jgi:hypothetical protein
LALGNTWSLPSSTTFSIPTFSHTFSGSTERNLTYQVGFARKLTSFRAGDLSLELSAAGFPRHIDTDFASVFVVPAVKFTFLPRNLISPFVDSGVGFVHLDGGRTSINAAAYQFGGGFDVRTPIRFLSFRLQVRDYLASESGLASPVPPPNPLGITVKGSSRNHALAGGGVVLRF